VGSEYELGLWVKIMGSDFRGTDYGDRYMGSDYGVRFMGADYGVRLWGQIVGYRLWGTDYGVTLWAQVIGSGYRILDVVSPNSTFLHELRHTYEMSTGVLHHLLCVSCPC
jgi:hypothetical protein